MAYTTIDDPSAYFNTVLYSGNSSTQSITGVGFQPDWVWIKSRSTAYNHNLHDSSRGTTKVLWSNDSAQENFFGDSDLDSFDSDGFTLTNSSNYQTNNSASTYTSWNWKANGGTTASNTDGSITSTVQANTTAGFSIVTYTGNGSTGATIGHGLGAVPSMFIIKRRSGTEDWVVYHHKNTSAPETDYLLLNTTDATADSDTRFNDTAPTSTLITMGNNAVINGSGSTYVGYAFAEKQGYSKFGSYEGNANADGPFIYTGFKPAFIILKRNNAVSDWEMNDNKRNGYNGGNVGLTPNTTSVEATANELDLLSNGFKIRTTNDNWNPASGQTLIYMAFAESPFVSSDGVPTTAR